MNKIFKKEFLKSQRGITLIALVVTIIVLLILAGVTLNLVSGSDGILGKAEKAVSVTNESAIQEEVELLMAGWNMDYYDDGTEIEGRTETTGSGATATYSEGTVTYTSKDGKTYIIAVGNNGSVGKVEEENETNSQSYRSRHPENHIPTGFHYLTGSVETGYVITDGTNEFVWIPIASSADYSKKLGTNNWYLKAGSSGTDTASSLGNNVSNGIKGDILGVSSILGTTVSSTLSETATEYEVVKKAGGFWVGRYEAGIANAEHSDIAGINGWSGDSTNAENSNTYWEEKRENIVVKQDTEPVRNITQQKALSIANNWKSGVEDETKETVAFQSGLITGSQWDAMCKFIGWNTCDSDCSSWGNYNNVVGASYTGYHSTDGHSDWVNSTTAVTKLGDGTNRWIFPTGKFVKSGASTPNTVQKNIYDVAGNVWEWTTEVPCYSANNSVLRGGSAYGYGSDFLAIFRDGDRSSSVNTSWHIGFRLVLYVE